MLGTFCGVVCRRRHHHHHHRILLTSQIDELVRMRRRRDCEPNRIKAIADGSRQDKRISDGHVLRELREEVPENSCHELRAARSTSALDLFADIHSPQRFVRLRRPYVAFRWSN